MSNIEREADGRLKKGQILNPGGRPKTRGLPSLIRAKTNDYITIIDMLIDIVQTGSNKDKIAAAKVLLDRGLGQPRQTIDTNITTPDPIQFICDR